MPSHQTWLRLANSVFLLLLSLNLSAAFDPDLLQGLSARSIGPAAVSGRISAIDALQSDPNHIVIGAATGGGGFLLTEA